MNSSQYDWNSLDAMTDKDRHAAAVADAGAQPLSDADIDRMWQTPRLKVIRRALEQALSAGTPTPGARLNLRKEAP